MFSYSTFIALFSTYYVHQNVVHSRIKSALESKVTYKYESQTLYLDSFTKNYLWVTKYLRINSFMYLQLGWKVQSRAFFLFFFFLSNQQLLNFQSCFSLLEANYLACVASFSELSFGEITFCTVAEVWLLLAPLRAAFLAKVSAR